MSQKFQGFHIIPELPDGTHLDGIQGKLTKLHKWKNGEDGTYGPWSMQGGELQDKAGAIVPVVFKNREVIPPSWQGQWLIITAHHGEKGLNGLIAEDNTHNGKTTRRVKITGMAEIAFAGGDTPAPANPQQRPQPQGQGGGQRGQEEQYREPQGQRQQATQQRQQGQPQPQQQPPGPPKKPPVHGQTVGMAVKESIGLISKGNHPPEFYTSPEFFQLVHEIASDIIRISQYLEKGELAPSAKVRARTSTTTQQDDTDPANLQHMQERKW